MPGLPSVSVVVACRPRLPHVRSCLEALARVEYPPELVEVIVVNMGSPDGMDELMRATRADLPTLNARFFRQGSATGHAAVCNLAIANARHEVAAFVGETAAPDRMWLRHGVARLAAAGAGAVEGAIVRAMASEQTCFSSEPPVVRGGEYSLANMFVRMELFEALGLFDNRLSAPDGGAAGVEFVRRAADAGWDIPFAPDAVCVMQESVSSWRHSIREARRSYFDPLLRKLHPGHSEHRLPGRTRRMAWAASRWGNLLSLPMLIASGIVGWQLGMAVSAAAYGLTFAAMVATRMRDANIPIARIAAVLPIMPAVPWLHAYHRARGILRVANEPARAQTGVVRLEELGIQGETFSPGRRETVSTDAAPTIDAPHAESVAQEQPAQSGTWHI